MNLMGRKMIKEDEAEEAASVDADGVDDSHELAKQLFDDLLDDSQDDPWSDPSWIGSNLAEPPSISQPKQSAPSTLDKLRSWIARLLSGGGGVKDTTAKLIEDVCALKRLQRDAFEQLLRLSERLDEVERESDSSGVGSTAGTTLLASAGGRKRTAAGTSGRSQVHVSGQVVYGREYLSLEAGRGESGFDEDNYQPPAMHVNLSTVSQDTTKEKASQSPPAISDEQMSLMGTH
ncbi:hypothetical protein WJX75_008088 [Coccomyxa subellipsoidea]|uniref:Uncharacterized protein n=1 Tax=Coccomyxa subellipsoidea TaxID=248742 RepID=A0ABR2Z2H7_9CHLO